MHVKLTVVILSLSTIETVEMEQDMNFDVIRERYFPMMLPANIVGQVVDQDKAFEVGRITAIFDPVALGHFQTPASRLDRVKQLEGILTHSGSESIAFYDRDGTPAGWAWGYMEYADTFTLDTFGLIPAYRGRGVYKEFIQRFLSYLTDVGYEKMTIHTHANNRAMLIANLKAGCSIVGMENRANGGFMIKLAYHLHDDRRTDFCQTFRMLPES